MGGKMPLFSRSNFNIFSGLGEAALTAPAVRAAYRKFTTPVMAQPVRAATDKQIETKGKEAPREWQVAILYIKGGPPKMQRM